MYTKLFVFRTGICFDDGRPHPNVETSHGMAFHGEKWERRLQIEGTNRRTADKYASVLAKAA